MRLNVTPTLVPVLMEDVLHPAWEVAAELVDALEGSGRGAFWLTTLGRITLAHRENHGELGQLYVAGWTANVTPASNEVEYVKRQLLRSAGFEEREPAQRRLTHDRQRLARYQIGHRTRPSDTRSRGGRVRVVRSCRGVRDVLARRAFPVAV